MRLHETWRLSFLVKELASDIMTTILKSPLDVIILCEIHQELFKDVNILHGELYTKCLNLDSSNSNDSPERAKRNIEEREIDEFDDDDDTVELVGDIQKDENIKSVSRHQEKHNSLFFENLDLSGEQTAEGSSHQEQDNPTLGEHSENSNCHETFINRLL